MSRRAAASQPPIARAGGAAANDAYRTGRAAAEGSSGEERAAQRRRLDNERANVHVASAREVSSYGSDSSPPGAPWARTRSSRPGLSCYYNNATGEITYVALKETQPQSAAEADTPAVEAGQRLTIAPLARLTHSESPRRARPACRDDQWATLDETEGAGLGIEVEDL